MENTNQMMDLSADEMLELYKTMTHLAPVRRECTIERDDGIDLDAWLTLRLQQWYAQLLLTAPDLVPGKEKSWLMKVALNRCRDLWRSAWLKRVTLGIEKVERHRAPDRTDEFLEREELLDAIGRLSPDMRSVVLLHYYQGMGVSEIAELLNVPEGTVSSRLSRSRSRLEDLLKERE